MPSNSAESEAFEVAHEMHFGVTDKGIDVVVWDLIKDFPATVAADRITEALNRAGTKVDWETVYRALTEPI